MSAKNTLYDADTIGDPSGQLYLPPGRYKLIIETADNSIVEFREKMTEAGTAMLVSKDGSSVQLSVTQPSVIYVSNGNYLSCAYVAFDTGPVTVRAMPADAPDGAC